MINILAEDVRSVLTYYHKLFNYKTLFLFPRIQNTSIEPIFIVNSKERMTFTRCKEMDWLNFYQGLITRDTVSKYTYAKEFFEFYNLDMLFPIQLDTTCYGFLGICSYGRKANQVELQIGELIIHYLASLWKNIELMQDVRQSSEQTKTLLEEASTLMEISRAIESGKDIQSLLEFIMEKCMLVMRAEAASLMLMTEDDNELEFKVALGPKGKIVKSFRLPIGKGIAGWVAKEAKPLLIPDAYNDERFDSSFDEKSGFRTKSILCVPMLYNNRVIGVAQALNRFDDKPFNEDDLRTFTIFAGQAALAIENSRLLFSVIEKEKLEKDIEIASEIQRLIIPEKLPDNLEIEMNAAYIPCKQVGGDFYAVFPVNENETIFCIADVAGKGVPGALLVSTLHATLKAYLDFSSDLILIIKKLNQLIIELSTADRFITLFLGCYDKRSSKLLYINAGHNPPILINKNYQIKKLESNGICIGIIPFEYKVVSIPFEKDSILVMFTDGVVEARNKEDQVFGEENLIKIINENKSKGCRFIKNEIVEKVIEHTGEQQLADDLTLLIIKENKRS
jgi:sigma-B regulation protein RsbU (phosphoserine phosphatase)